MNCSRYDLERTFWGCCPTNPGVRVSGLVHQPHERTVEVARECQAPRALQLIVGNIPYEKACRLFDLSVLVEGRLSCNYRPY